MKKTIAAVLMMACLISCNNESTGSSSADSANKNEQDSGGTFTPPVIKEDTASRFTPPVIVKDSTPSKKG